MENGSDGTAATMFRSCMKNGSVAFLTKNIGMAFEFCHIAWGIFTEKGAKLLMLDENEVLAMKFSIAFIAAYKKTFKSEDLASCIFYEILGLPANNCSSIAHYGLALVRYYLGSFQDAIKDLQIAQFLLYTEMPNPIKWFGTEEIIPQTKMGVLMISITQLFKKCANPMPDAVCLYNQCTERYIFFDAVRFQGLVRTQCSEKCNTNYHPLCWEKYKAENEKASDEDVFHSHCQTPNCGANIIDLLISDSNNSVCKVIQNPPLPAPSVAQEEPQIETNPVPDRELKCNVNYNPTCEEEFKKEENNGETFDENIQPQIPPVPQQEPENCVNAVPDAYCRYDNCDNEEIFYNDAKFQGLVCVRCSEKCNINYHPACWKEYKAGNGKTSDKSMLDFRCQTPDCGANNTEIHMYNSSNILRKIVQNNQAHVSVGKQKPKTKLATPRNALPELKKKNSVTKKFKKIKVPDEEVLPVLAEIVQPTSSVTQAVAPDVAISDCKFLLRKGESNKDLNIKAPKKKKKALKLPKENDILPISVNLTDHGERISKLQQYKAAVEGDAINGFPYPYSAGFPDGDASFAFPYEHSHNLAHLETLFRGMSSPSGRISEFESSPSQNSDEVTVDESVVEEIYFENLQQNETNIQDFGLNEESNQNDEIILAVERIAILENQLQFANDSYFKVMKRSQVEKRDLINECDGQKLQIMELEQKLEILMKQVSRQNNAKQKAEKEFVKLEAEKSDLENVVIAEQNENKKLHYEVNILNGQLQEAIEARELSDLKREALLVEAGSAKEMQEALSVMEMNYSALMIEKKELEVTLRHLMTAMKTPDVTPPHEDIKTYNAPTINNAPINGIPQNNSPVNRMGMVPKLKQLPRITAKPIEGVPLVPVPITRPFGNVLLRVVAATPQVTPHADILGPVVGRPPMQLQATQTNRIVNRAAPVVWPSATGAVPKQRVAATAALQPGQPSTAITQIIRKKGTMGLDKFEELPSSWMSGTQKPVVEECHELCVICMEDNPHHSIITLECKHQFHLKCIKTWFNCQSTCPFCRRHIGLPDFPPLV